MSRASACNSSRDDAQVLGEQNVSWVAARKGAQDFDPFGRPIWSGFPSARVADDHIREVRRIRNPSPRYVVYGPKAGLFGCQARYDSFPLSRMIRGVLSPGLVVSVDRP